MNKQRVINEAIHCKGFTEETLQLINDYIADIQNGTEDFPRFNLSEHAGLCTAGAPLIGASIVASYTTTSFEASCNAESCTGNKPANWEIDAKQEEVVQSHRHSLSSLRGIGQTSFSKEALLDDYLSEKYGISA